MSWKVLLCLFGDFCMDLYSVDSDQALNASSLQFLSSVKLLHRFIATIFSER
jgi:hypothetical protein